MTTYAVTAASGRLGRLVVEALLERGVAAPDVVAVVRTPAKVADLAGRGVQVREGDYTRPETLAAALAGVDRLLLVSSDAVGQRVAQHTNVVEAAKAAGVQRIAYTSILRAGSTANPLAPEHEATEGVLAASGVPVTFLRNGWYTENYTAQLPQQLASGTVLGATRDAPVSAATRADYAAAAAAALLLEDAEDHVFELGGPAITFTELAATITAVTGTDVVHRDLSPQEYAGALQGAGVDAGTAAFLASLDASVAAGELFTASTDLADLMGRPATPLAEAVRAAAA